MESFSFPGEDLDSAKVANSPFALNNNDFLISSHLQKRYSTISIPATYGNLNSGPAPGTVAGIVLGSVGGVVIILYLTFLALNPGGLARGSSASTVDEEVIVRSRRAPSSRRRSEMIEVVEERDRRDSYRRRMSPDRIVVEESMTGTATTDGDNVIQVFEEESSGISSASPRPPRRARSYRSGVRTVDPLEYGGGSESGVSRY